MIEESKHYALAIACGAKRGPKDSDLTFSPASLRDFLKALDQPEQEPVAWRTKNATPPGGYVVFQQYPQAVADLYGEIEPLYTAPQPRQLQGLTRREFQKAVEGLEDLEDCWIAIQAAILEKNT